jgi:hypothetical protein
MFTPKELEKRKRFRVYPTLELDFLFGEVCKFDGDGRRYVDAPAHANIRTIVTELHPDWECSEDFFDMEGMEELPSKPKAKAKAEVVEPEPESDIEEIQ